MERYSSRTSQTSDIDTVSRSSAVISPRDGDDLDFFSARNEVEHSRSTPVRTNRKYCLHTDVPTTTMLPPAQIHPCSQERQTPLFTDSRNPSNSNHPIVTPTSSPLTFHPPRRVRSNSSGGMGNSFSSTDSATDYSFLIDVNDDGTEVTLVSEGDDASIPDSANSPKQSINDGTPIGLTPQTNEKDESPFSFFTNAFNCTKASNVDDSTLPDESNTHNDSNGNTTTAQSLSGEASAGPINVTGTKIKFYTPELICGQGCWTIDDVENSPTKGVPQRSIEMAIDSLLGDPLGHDWQHALPCFKIENSPQIKAARPEDVGPTFRNRAFDTNARSKRIRHLKKNLSPFSSSWTPNDHMPPPYDIKRSRSVCDIKLTTESRRRAARPVSPATDTTGSVASECSAVWESVQACGGIPAAASPEPSPDLEEDNLCYDSDPGEYTEDHDTDEKDVATFLKTGGWTHPHDGHRRTRSFVMDAKFPDPAMNLDWRNDRLIKKSVQNAIHKRTTLVWHRQADSSGKPHHPLAVTAWIEPGSQLRTGLLQPKLMWKPIETDSFDQSMLGLQNLNFEHVELMNISRVLSEGIHIDRNKFPLAKQACSFYLETVDETFLFEAGCPEAKDEFGQDIKLLVARLGSKVLTGDETLFDEFFSHQFASPGEIPTWADTHLENEGY
eukprot:scaffold4515_cov42-Attheya_sp.AAC.3